MSGHRAHGKRLATLGDSWRALLDRQQRPAPAQGEPIQPSTHVAVRWCGHTWACECEPKRKEQT